MSKEKFNVHYVCTLSEAQKLVKKHKHFWVSNCGCREGQRNKCKRSRIDVCLYFTDTFGSSGTGFRRSKPSEAKRILREARDKFLVCRPFRDSKKKNIIDGICFCCDCCCGYFLDSKYRCDKGEFIEKTNLEKCKNCGSCVDVCYFKARKMDEGELRIVPKKCYGCGLCIDACPQASIEMRARQ